MPVKHTIIITEMGRPLSSWSSLTEVCGVYGFPYYTLNKLKFPIEYGGYVLYKVPHKVKVLPSDQNETQDLSKKLKMVKFDIDSILRKLDTGDQNK